MVQFLSTTSHILWMFRKWQSARFNRPIFDVRFQALNNLSPNFHTPRAPSATCSKFQQVCWFTTRRPTKAWRVSNFDEVPSRTTFLLHYEFRWKNPNILNLAYWPRIEFSNTKHDKNPRLIKCVTSMECRKQTYLHYTVRFWTKNRNLVKLCRFSSLGWQFSNTVVWRKPSIPKSIDTDGLAFVHITFLTILTRCTAFAQAEAAR